MALNRVDARQRAFQAIDTSNPAGTWIDESGYNRCSSGVLCGNWQEDGILKESKAALGPGLHETLNPKADWGNPKEGRKFNKVPNFQSTEFLINARLDSDDWKSEKMQSYQGQQVNTRPDGTRSKAVSREILKATDQVLQQTAVQESPRGQYYWQSESSAMASNVGFKPARPRDPADPADSYLKQIPITSYWDGNNMRGTDGLTVASTDCPMKRNTNFSTPMGHFKKAPTHMF